MKEQYFKAELRQLEAVQGFLATCLKHRCEADDYFMLSLVVEELFVNIVSYAYPEEKGQFMLGCELNQGEQEVELFLEDGGVPFNPLEVKEPNLEVDAEQREIGSLGIYLVRACMDQISYEHLDGRNRLVLKKKVKLL